MRKVAMVTGGLKGIGLGIVTVLAQEGYALSVLATSPPERVQSNINALPQPVLYTQGDLSLAADRIRYLANTLDCYGRVDVLVNNAGIAPKERADVLEMSEDSLTRLIDVNLKGTTMLTQLVARQMAGQEEQDNRRGTIITITSISAYTASVNRGEYCISKAGLSMMTQLFASRLAGLHIPVFEIRPGVIETDMTAGVHEKYDALIADGFTPINRWGQPEEIGHAVSLLCDTRLTFTTGQVLDIDGGFHIRRL